MHHGDYNIGRITSCNRGYATILRTQALTRRFGALVAVDRLQLWVAAGEVFGQTTDNLPID